MSITENNIYEKGILLALHMGGFAGRKKMSDDQLQGLPTEIVRGVQDMFGNEFKALLAAIWTFDGETRSMVKRETVPFPVDGIYFISLNRLNGLVEVLEARKEERKFLAQAATDSYESAIVDFAAQYPAFYEAAKHKYVSKDVFASKFHFDYRILKIAPPNPDDAVLSPEMYANEMAKFKQGIEEMKSEVLSTIAQTLLDATQRLTEQCSDGKPNQRTLNNLNKFLVQIDEVYSDFIDRKDIKEVIAGIRAQVLGVDAKALRENSNFKREFKDAVAKAAESIQALPDVQLRRAMEF